MTTITNHRTYCDPSQAAPRETTRNRSLPKEAFTIRGGCSCKANRYTVSIPPHFDRPPNPYRIPGSTVDGDPRIPMIVVDHCNDCRRATGALLPMALVSDISWVATTCVSRTGDGDINLPASELFNFETIASRNVYLTCYKSSAGRSRWFCARCGTSLSYTIDPDEIPEEWEWPKMLDIWLGTVDREDLEKDFMAPERQLWCDSGVPWIRGFARNGGNELGIPEHPTTKINEVVDQSRGIDQILEEARSHLVRVTPEEAFAEVSEQTSSAPVILVDIRPAAQREAEGWIESALVVERNVLEWRFDPRSEARLPVAGSYDLRVIIFCQESYTSSLAARALQELGLRNATDMVGGYQAWKDAGIV